MAIPEASRTVVFVCLHGAAKSVLAAADLERLGRERGVPVRGVARGTEPDPEVAPAVSRALAADGTDLGAFRPRPVTAGDLRDAWRVVTFGPDLSELAPPGVPVLRWDVPAVGDDLPAARAAIGARLTELLDTWSP